MAIAAQWSIDTYVPQPGKPIFYTEQHQSRAKPIILAHILDLLHTLMTIGVEQLEEATSAESSPTSGTVVKSNSSQALARFITAPFRRMLPAMRIASRWLEAYASSILLIHDSEQTDSRIGVIESDLSRALDELWPAFAKLSTKVLSTFPVEKLPAGEVELEEDVELRAFLPIEADGSSSQATGSRKDSSIFHPNDEHLIRLREFQKVAVHLGTLEVRMVFHCFE
jgi:hypothetical protein